MSLLDTATALFAPHDCLGCGREGLLLCTDCRRGLIAIPERCFRCRQLSPAAKTCPNCRRVTKLSHVRAATIYDGAAKDIIWHFKFQGAQAAARLMAKQMSPLIPPDSKSILVHIPTATERVRQRGYDQARLLARALSKETRLPCLPALVRVGQHHQVGAHREQRLTQLANAFRVAHSSLIQNKNIILVDDVLTTGATLSTAAQVLKKAGANQVDAVVFAQA